jgi:hypothetical protein
MVHAQPAVTVPLAAAQLPVERIQHVPVELADLDATDQRDDVSVNISLVATLRARSDRQHGQVTLQQLGDRGAGAWTATFIHLALKSGASPLG